MIYEGCRFLDKLFECNDTGFFEAVYSPDYFEIDVSIGFKGELLFVHNFIGY